MKKKLFLTIRYFASFLGMPLFILLKFAHHSGLVKRVIVLIFHDVPESDKAKFSNIVKFLNRHFAFISPTDFSRFFSGDYRPKGINFLVTFDDGFKSSFIAAQEILDPMDIKAVFFCAGGFIDLPLEEGKRFVAENIYLGGRSREDIKSYEIPMTKTEVLSLKERGHYIACHSFSHPILVEKTSEELAKDFHQSKTILKECTNQEIEWIAYPFGKISCVDKRSLQIVKENYRLCFSGIRGAVERKFPYAIPRVSVTIAEPFWLQVALLLGVANWFHFPKLKRLRGYST